MDVIFKPELEMSQIEFTATEQPESETYIPSENQDEEESYETESIHNADDPYQHLQDATDAGHIVVNRGSDIMEDIALLSQATSIAKNFTT
jgi:hypothetical protein